MKFWLALAVAACMAAFGALAWEVWLTSSLVRSSRRQEHYILAPLTGKPPEGLIR